mmetsp:Transcript_40055/g.94049  ORF Transcript_40055/g.94049 Transcript_40055/m.94049 type:complete len:488 (-) Transcript_40055:503-1966(-)
MSFFDTTPVGRIINRFSKDIYVIDEKIPSNIRSYLGSMVSVVAVVAVVAFVTPAFAICLVPMVLFYSRQQRYFSKTYRELTRLDSVARSPLYGIFGETLDGVATVRAYGVQDFLTGRIARFLTRQQTAFFLTFSTQCWLAVRLEAVGTAAVACSCLAAVYGRHVRGAGEAYASAAGLAVSFALSVTQSLNWSVRMGSELESNMVAVERVAQYCAIESEAPRRAPGDEALGRSWPGQGEIRFDGVFLRYRAGLPAVLRGLSLTVPGRAKVGVVGRTGAGKSTLMVALLRLVEIESGSIRIDGVSIRSVGLGLLRSKIAVIPQDPTLFSGTIRSNLDPFSDYTDERLLEVLERVGLRNTPTGQARASHSAVESLSDDVSEGGSNFSVGQRQLIVIARALLCRAAIVIMDEATSSVDVETDLRIQRIMRTEFIDATCIIIAHRLNTIMDSDYILVMDDGRAAEFDAPSNLVKRPGGAFKKLVDSWEKDHA